MHFLIRTYLSFNPFVPGALAARLRRSCQGGKRGIDSGVAELLDT